MADGSRVPRRLLHTSDLHLELLNDRGCRSLDMVVDIAIMTNVDLVIIAGDFFDSNRVKDDVVSFAKEHLQRVSVDTVILPGNHDCLVPDSVYNRVKLWNGATNVRVLRALEGETLALPHLGISVWGKPLASYGGDAGPLAGMPQPQRDGQWHIAVAHGYFMGPQARSWASFHVTTEEIIASYRDYVALGDSHAFSCVNNEPVKAYYPGSPSSGTETVAIVDLVEGTGTQVTCYSLPYLFPGSP